MRREVKRNIGSEDGEERGVQRLRRRAKQRFGQMESLETRSRELRLLNVLHLTFGIEYNSLIKVLIYT